MPPSVGGAVFNGWRFLAWPDFDARWSALILEVARRRSIDPIAYTSTSASRMLRAVNEVIRDRIARDPNAADFRLRGDLSAWRRVKFLGRFRLFYRFDSTTRTVILTWLNDENTLRKDGARSDPYAVFVRMLTRGDIPSDWDALAVGAAALDPYPPDDPP